MDLRTALNIISTKVLLKANLPRFALRLPFFGLNKIDPALNYFEAKIFSEIEGIKKRLANHETIERYDILSLLVTAAESGSDITPREVSKCTAFAYVMDISRQFYVLLCR